MKRAAKETTETRETTDAGHGASTDRRLADQLAFLVEIDRLKTVLRMTCVVGESRRENSAEHSWHLALMAPVLAEYAPEEVDLQRVMTMVLLHDVVEIDAGDTFAFDEAAHHDKEAREQAAARRIFGLLPDDQGVAFRALWEEFEEGRTADARFANALDRLQGALQNLKNGGGTWRDHGISRERILQRQRPIEAGAPPLWPVLVDMVDRLLEEMEAVGAPGSGEVRA